MGHMKNIFLSLFCCAALFADDFVVGTTSGYAPYVSLSEKGEYEGFDIDFARLLAEKLGKKLVLKDLGTMPGLMVGLSQGKIDAVIWAVSMTEERMGKVDMVYYQGERVEKMPLVFWGKVPEGVKGPGDLPPNVSVSVEAGSYQEGVLRTYPHLKIKNVDTLSNAICEIKFGKSAAIAMDNSLVPTALKQYPELKVVYFSLPANWQSLGNGVCLKKGTLSDEVKKAVQALRDEGKIDELEKKWNLK